MRTGGFTEQSDVVRIAAKVRDVGFYPTQGRKLVLQSVVA